MFDICIYLCLLKCATKKILTLRPQRAPPVVHLHQSPVQKCTDTDIKNK